MTGEIIAIIPARGGSKRVPGKNVRQVGGIPLLAHSIRHAHAATMVSEVLVSTDDPELAEIARSEGAGVVMRPPALADDQATSESALLHALDVRVAAGMSDPDLVVFLQCTSPVRAAGDIDGAIDTLRRQNADSLFSATHFNELIWRRTDEGLGPINYNFQRRQREQDMVLQYRENGSIYVFKPDILRKLNNRLGGRIAVYEMDYWSSFQLDTEEHVRLLEWVIRTPASQTIEHRDLDLVVFDFDGVMTNNLVLVDQDGLEAVLCNRSDGLGLAELKASGMRMLVISTETNPVVQARCRKLGLECLSGIADKAAALRQFLTAANIKPARVAFIGNDRNDLPAMALVGWPIAVADAWPEVLERARIRLSRQGGMGAVREFCDLLIHRQGPHAG